MAETVGSLVDKLTIVELRRFHTEQAMLNCTATIDVRHAAALRLRIIDEQRADLQSELDTLWAAIRSGATLPKVYRQLKLYNDPAMRSASSGTPES
jgi:hypothetical protein